MAVLYDGLDSLLFGSGDDKGSLSLPGGGALSLFSVEVLRGVGVLMVKTMLMILI
jgi:hypothetical protein